MTPRLKQTTTVSSKGQVVLPKAIRAHRKWNAGTRLVVEDTPHGVLLKSESPFPPTTIDEVFGIARYVGPTVSIEEMDEAVAAMFRRKRDSD